MKYPEGGPIETYVGADNYGDYEANQANLGRYNLYNNAGQSLVDQGIFSDPSQLSSEQFSSTFPDFTLPEGATGATRFNVAQGSNFSESIDPNLQGNFYSDPGGQYGYVPTFDKPTDEYSLVDSPEQKQIKSDQLAWDTYLGDSGTAGFNREWIGDLDNPGQGSYEYTPTNTEGTGGNYVSAGNLPAEARGQFLPQQADPATFVGGGKLGDSLKMAGDTLLSTVGLTDVIGDDFYKNQSFADASRVGESLGKGLGVIAGNVIAPGVGGALVSQGQNILGNVDGEDSDRARMEQIRANPEAYGKHGKNVSQMNNAINPLVTGTDIAGKVGNAALGNFQDTGNILGDFQMPQLGDTDLKAFGGELNPIGDFVGQKQSDAVLNQIAFDKSLARHSNADVQGKGNVSFMDSLQGTHTLNKRNKLISGIAGTDFDKTSYLDALQGRKGTVASFAYGGEMNQQADGGKFIEYQGPTHDGGGIAVDENGVPTNGASNKEVEGGETLHDDGIENYVFSDRLMIDPKKKNSFADASKKINNKYKNATDKIATNSRDMELEQLKQEQETFKASISSNDNSTQLAHGGGLNPTTEQYYGVINNALGQVPQVYAPTGAPSGLDANLAFTGNNLSPDNIQSPVGNDPQFRGNPLQLRDDTIGEFTLDTQPKSDVKANPFTESLPQDKINPLGYISSNIGNVYDIAQASKETKANDFGRANFEGINLEPQREELRRQAGVSQAIARENSRGSVSAGASKGNQTISNALVSSSLGSGLSQSYMTEANRNAQIANQAEQINTQIGMQETIADQQDAAKRKSTTSQALHSMGMNTQGYVKDLTSAKVGNMNNEMWFELVSKGQHNEMKYHNGKFIQVVKDDDGNYYDVNTREKVTVQ